MILRDKFILRNLVAIFRHPSKFQIQYVKRFPKLHLLLPYKLNIQFELTKVEVPIECISHVAFYGAPFTCQAVSALTMDVPVIDFMVINIIVIAAPLLQCQMLILMLKSSLFM